MTQYKRGDFTEIHQKLYAYLVGQIDETLQLICDDLLNGKHGFAELNEVGERLKKALLTAEEMYLDETEELQD